MYQTTCLKALIIVAALSHLAACKPPASDAEIASETMAEIGSGPSTPIASPDSEGAIWSPSTNAGRIIYGQPGAPPYLALACENAGPDGLIRMTRYVAADEEAEAFLALIGNGHVARIPVDAVWNGRAWIWEGTLSAHSQDLEVLTGLREATATVPGAGQITLNSSHAPAQLIAGCRGEVSPLSQ